MGATGFEPETPSVSRALLPNAEKLKIPGFSYVKLYSRVLASVCNRRFAVQKTEGFRSISEIVRNVPQERTRPVSLHRATPHCANSALMPQSFIHSDIWPMSGFDPCRHDPKSRSYRFFGSLRFAAFAGESSWPREALTIVSRSRSQGCLRFLPRGRSNSQCGDNPGSARDS